MSMIVKSFDIVNFRKHLINQIDRAGKAIDRCSKGTSEAELREYIYNCGRENALTDLLHDMELFAKLEEKEKLKNED